MSAFDAFAPRTTLNAVKAKYGLKTAKPTGKSTYVASKNSKVFHFPDCVWAKKIKKEAKKQAKVVKKKAKELGENVQLGEN